MPQIRMAKDFQILFKRRPNNVLTLNLSISHNQHTVGQASDRGHGGGPGGPPPVGSVRPDRLADLDGVRSGLLGLGHDHLEHAVHHPVYGADVVAVQDVRVAASLVKGLLDRVGQRGLSGAGKSGEPEDRTPVAFEFMALFPNRGAEGVADP